MSRRHSASKRVIEPDSVYGDVLVSKLINKVMFQGKKSLAEKIVHGAFKILETKYSLDPFQTFKEVMNTLRPPLYLISVRVGGASHRVPQPCEVDRGNNLAFEWLIKSMRARSENASVNRLAEELFDAFNKRGLAFKKHVDHNKEVEANRAFSHYSPRSKTKKAGA